MHNKLLAAHLLMVRSLFLVFPTYAPVSCDLDVDTSFEYILLSHYVGELHVLAPKPYENSRELDASPKNVHECLTQERDF